MNEVNNILKKKKWYKRKWPYFLLVAVLLIGGVAYGQYNKSQQPVKYETTKVLRGVLKQTVEATGNIDSKEELDLRFENAGKIVRIYKQTSAQVKKGEILAELDNSVLNAGVAQANASVAQAQANLDKIMAGNTPEYIAGLQASLDKAKADLDQVEGITPGVENSKIVQNAYDNTISTLQSVQNSFASALTQADNILGVDNTLANSAFKDYLSNLDSSKLNNAKLKYLDAKSAKEKTDLQINTINKLSDHKIVDDTILVAEDTLMKMKDMLFAVSEVLDKTSPVGTLTATSLDTMKSNIQTSRVDVVAKYSSLVTQAHSIETARSTYFSYLALVDRAVAALNDAKNPPRTVDVAGYKAAVAQAQANLAQAVANRAKSIIISPVDGTVGKVNFKVGEYVSPTDAIINIINPHFQVKVDIPETDIVKISLNNQAAIKLDAYGDDIKFNGTVTQIEKGRTVIQDVVYYNVTVSLDDNKQYQVLAGMTASVTFSTEEKNNVLYVNQRALRTNADGTKYVKVLENGQPKDVQIKTGLRADEGLTEIIEGLQEGQEVILGTVTK